MKVDKHRHRTYAVSIEEELVNKVLRLHQHVNFSNLIESLLVEYLRNKFGIEYKTYEIVYNKYKKGAPTKQDEREEEEEQDAFAELFKKYVKS